MKLNKKLYISRVIKGYTQKDVAKMIGTSAPLISLYEKGISKPSQTTFEKLAIIYNFDKKYIEETKAKLNIREKLDGMSDEEKLERARQQVRKATKKYYKKNKNKFHQYYEERKNNGISRNKK